MAPLVYRVGVVVQKCYLDFETRSADDIKKAGAHHYSEHWTTDIMCVGYAFDDEPPNTVDALNVPETVLQHVDNGGLVVAHNAPFELAIWNNVGVKRYGWPILRPEQTDCTMARAYAMALPGSLDGAAAALGIGIRKDMKGHRKMLKLSQPRKRHGDGTFTWWEPAEHPEEFIALFDYCGQDIIVERELDKRLLALPAKEKKLWLVDFEINNRGVLVDIDAVNKAIDIVKLEEERLQNEIQEVTGLKVTSYKAPVQIKQFLESQGVKTKGVAKDDVIELLAREDLPQACRRALEIRQEAAKSSTAKLKNMLAGVCSDGRLKGMFQYHGASTGRFAGRRVQFQNFPRPTMKQDDIEEVFGLLEKFAPHAARESIDAWHGTPLSVLSDCLRGFLVAPPGKRFLAADFSAIEARVLAWLAQEKKVLDVFRTHGKIYEHAASEIYVVPLDRVSKEQRQVGKCSVLALGYQGGVGAYQTIAKNYQVKMAPAFASLWARASEERRSRAMDRWESDGVDSGIQREEWLASELTKLAWREKHANIVRYWGLVGHAAVNAVKTPGKTFRVHAALPPILFKTSGSFLWCKLPSGRNLCYPYPQISMRETKWGSRQETLTYMTEDATTRKWVRHAAYGGLLVENITQAVARDALTDAMLRPHKRGDVVLHVHDELVIEAREWDGKGVDFALHGFEKAVGTVPDWAQGLPMKAEGWAGKRYRK